MRRCIILFVGLAGCGTPDWGWYQDKDSRVSVAPCAQLHRCAVKGGDLFDGMSVYQIGPRAEIEQITCPEFIPHTGTVRYGDLGDTSYTCGTCDCGPAACALPTVMDVSTAKCMDGGGQVAPWDAPDAWEGTCTDMDAPVSGGGSLTVEAPPILPCAPLEGPHVDPAPLEPALMARECVTTLERGTCGEGELCAPELPPDDPLTLCLFRRGEEDPSIECPPDFPRRFVMFGDHADHRGCTPCECGPQVGAACSALISLYTDAACADDYAGFPVSAPDPGCFDLPAGVSLGSKTGMLKTDVPGTCAASGGIPSGGVEIKDPITLCCESVEGPAR